MFRRQVIYVQVYVGYFLARVAGESRTIRRDCAGLIHPRTLFGDYNTIQAAMNDILKEFRTLQTYILKPHVLVHAIPKFEGGYTPIELRAFREVALVAGAGIPWLLDDRQGPLDDQQLSEIFGTLKSNPLL